MMEKLRTASNSIVIKIIFGVIILSFILTGVGGYLVGGSKDYAVKVNDHKISIRNFEQAVQNERGRLQQQMGDNFSLLAGDENFLKQMRQRVLSEMIDEVLLDQYASKLGLVVSDEMIKENIRNTPEFQTEQKFDNEKYLALVNRAGLTSEGYAQYIRQQLVRQQLLSGYLDTNFTEPTEVQEIASLALQSREVRLATINIKSLEEKQQFNDTDLQNYYQQNSTRFVAPERVKVSYIELDTSKLAETVQINEKDIEAYYDAHKEQFTQPEQRHYRIIQLKTEAEAKTVLQELKEGKDFGELVTEKSTDLLSRKAGGYLDWMDATAAPEELLQANLTEKGQLSDIIKFNDQFVIVELADIKPQQVKEFSAVKDELAKKVKEEKSLDLFYAEQQKLNEGATNDNESLESAEEAVGIKAVETDWFTRDTLPKALNYPLIEQAIFDGNLFDEKGHALGNSDVITIDNDRAFVLRVTGYQAEHTKPFDEVKDEVTQAVRQQKAEAEARAEGQKLLTALQTGEGEEALKEAGLAFSAKQVMTRDYSDRQLVESVFMLPHPADGKSSYGVAQDQQQNIVLVALDTVTPGALKDGDKKVFTDGLLRNSNVILLDTLIRNLHQEAKIEKGNVEG